LSFKDNSIFCFSLDEDPPDDDLLLSFSFEDDDLLLSLSFLSFFPDEEVDGFSLSFLLFDDLLDFDGLEELDFLEDAFLAISRLFISGASLELSDDKGVTLSLSLSLLDEGLRLLEVLGESNLTSSLAIAEGAFGPQT